MSAAGRPHVIVGGGIVGLATARALQLLDPGRPVVVIEKEPALASHQTGHNSGVIHSGIYYRPGSVKARLAVSGARELQEFCAGHGIPFDVPGKLIVAARQVELPRLEALLERGKRNGVKVRRAAPDEICEREPAIRAVAALAVESTGRADYRQVAQCLAQDIVAGGGSIRTGETVENVRPGTGGVPALVRTDRDVLPAHSVAACAGLHSDQFARACGIDPGVRILPFRGEYSELVPQRAHLVRGLVYPVPDPELPFLGIHLTRGLDGSVHLGPNAVPALAREGYSWRAISPRYLAGSVSYPGAWRLARRYGKAGAQEIARSLSGRSLVTAARAMLPDLRPADVRPAAAGVRAQAVARDGQLVDDFLFRRQGPVLHVLNAPSPAATASLAIGRYIAGELLAG